MQANFVAAPAHITVNLLIGFLIILGETACSQFSQWRAVIPFFMRYARELELEIMAGDQFRY